MKTLQIGAFEKRNWTPASIRIVSKLVSSYGPSSAARTHGLLVPNQARYQLRYTRIFSFCHYTTARGEKQSFFSLRSFMCTIHIGQVKKAMRDMVSCDKAELPHQLIRKRDHIPHSQENNTGHGISAIPDEEHGELRLRVRQPVYPDYFTFRAAFSWSTRSVRSQVTPRSSRPMCP